MSNRVGLSWFFGVGEVRRPLDEADMQFIASLPESEGYYIDGEFSFCEFGLWYGLTDRIDVGLGLRYLDFSGGFKWNTRLGVFGVGVNENLLNYDNTPDIGVHLRACEEIVQRPLSRES
ncbi:MAG: hypothetical protein ACRD2Z_07785 [Thermoanaerobaculia bacterium]